MTLEREIYSIEAANINKETLDAMKNASNAMKQIHGGLTIDKVDQTMEELRDQHAIGEEIGEAITQSVGTSALDETELDEELEALQQEELDNKMLETGATPANRLPSVPEGGKFNTAAACFPRKQPNSVQSKGKRRRSQKKKTRKQSCGSCRRRWLCKSRRSLCFNLLFIPET